MSLLAPMITLSVGCGAKPVAPSPKGASVHEEAGPVLMPPGFDIVDHFRLSKGRIADTVLTVHGSWRSADGTELKCSRNLTWIECHRLDHSLADSNLGYCSLYQAYVNRQLPLIVITELGGTEVERWDKTEVVLASQRSMAMSDYVSGGLCFEFRIRIDREAKEVIASGVYQPSASCTSREPGKVLLRMTATE
jgi:hypothetical protein